MSLSGGPRVRSILARLVKTRKKTCTDKCCSRVRTAPKVEADVVLTTVKTKVPFWTKSKTSLDFPDDWHTRCRLYPLIMGVERVSHV